ncbi:DUF3024 domain-containing protein [Pseudonocardia sp. TRM90224]|uniref:DUF3024 domain-containing protein n=1 Tax=Pseudonocardia sp. TRM90224 TaxID=2812678 RepID=UPI001E3ECBCE|nr:DUF3024 domain-containing protein [Pseudonocardia sp. TRM90224]
MHESAVDDAVARVQKWCAERVPERVRDHVRIECEPETNQITIVERRRAPDATTDWTRQPIVQLHHTPQTTLWALYWHDDEGRFHAYELLEPTDSVERLLTEIEDDPAGVFWG